MTETIWSIGHRYQFITMNNFDHCSDLYLELYGYGRKLGFPVDYEGTLSHCYNDHQEEEEELYGKKDSEDPCRCINNEFAFDYSLHYLQDFTEFFEQTYQKEKDNRGYLSTVFLSTVCPFQE